MSEKRLGLFGAPAITGVCVISGHEHTWPQACQVAAMQVRIVWFVTYGVPFMVQFRFFFNLYGLSLAFKIFYDEDHCFLSKQDGGQTYSRENVE